jgi:hypothetical protein
VVEPSLFSTREAAEFLGLSQHRVREFAREGRIGRRVGTCWVYLLAELEVFRAIPRPTGRRRPPPAAECKV